MRLQAATVVTAVWIVDERTGAMRTLTLTAARTVVVALDVATRTVGRSHSVAPPRPPSATSTWIVACGPMTRRVVVAMTVAVEAIVTARGGAEVDVTTVDGDAAARAAARRRMATGSDTATAGTRHTHATMLVGTVDETVCDSATRVVTAVTMVESEITTAIVSGIESDVERRTGIATDLVIETATTTTEVVVRSTVRSVDTRLAGTGTGTGMGAGTGTGQGSRHVGRVSTTTTAQRRWRRRV
jgi:hypothetical protein